MIYILTSFFNNHEWCDIQKHFLDCNLGEGQYQRISIVEFDEKIDINEFDNLEVIEHKKLNPQYHNKIKRGKVEQNDHFFKLDKLSEYVKTIVNDEDIIIFLDSDCFPIKTLDEEFFSLLNDFDSLSIKRHNRKYNKIEPIKPIFSAYKAKKWKELNLSWYRDWKTKKFQKLNHYILEETNETPCYNGREFCTYDNKIYHQGLGSGKEPHKKIEKHNEIMDMLRSGDVNFFKKIKFKLY